MGGLRCCFAAPVQFRLGSYAARGCVRPGRVRKAEVARVSEVKGKKSNRRRRRKSMRDELLELLEREDVRELEGSDARQQILLAIVQKALNGDLKTVEFILELTGELPGGKSAEQDGLRIELGPGVEELAK